MRHTVIRRSQHAVSQGAFHTGTITTLEQIRMANPESPERQTARFTYVYDSEQNSAFNGQMASHRIASSRRTDILFISTCTPTTSMGSIDCKLWRTPSQLHLI
ncbi:hypothetical protein RRH01S_16_00480 [Rhizobium rhizogenes NBRC 13257]|uniref:Uncharacterized protein n=1 Tax=Rhizobium rhizogenes NBRC 13257 TaxID=1220581 RepID=A0AA87QK02_RHIRH|nr:hypothetical protein RRH01S_16_00480 [Rhizobium rhizogenes NBRC 13257]